MNKLYYLNRIQVFLELTVIIEAVVRTNINIVYLVSINQWRSLDRKWAAVVHTSPEQSTRYSLSLMWPWNINKFNVLPLVFNSAAITVVASFDEIIPISFCCTKSSIRKKGGFTYTQTLLIIETEFCLFSDVLVKTVPLRSPGDVYNTTNNTTCFSFTMKKESFKLQCTPIILL